jgi:hypothetical protein
MANRRKDDFHDIAFHLARSMLATIDALTLATNTGTVIATLGAIVSEAFKLVPDEERLSLLAEWQTMLRDKVKETLP